MPTAPARTTGTVNNRGSGTGGSRRSAQPAQAAGSRTAAGTARLSAKLAALEASHDGFTTVTDAGTCAPVDVGVIAEAAEEDRAALRAVADDEMPVPADTGAAVSHNPVAGAWKGDAVARALTRRVLGIRFGTGTTAPAATPSA
ncbi:hypothetical protein [Streptomyces sp. SCL15-4]|uniref:hypothetical protein n=1 Tax=Streptomyces sp. SCL15-4 TaxID=2967221 RepID=UPI0029664AB3|nr:hypothetical protein [Streptomyces sp. SCL15-4]